MKPLYTIGYEGLSLDRFISILQKYNIGRVIDVRRNPISRKPGFSKGTLSQSLSQNHIKYSHIIELGTPDELRKALRTNDDYDDFFEGVEDYLKNQTESLYLVLDMAITETCALLCFERNHQECHRSAIAATVAQLSNLEITIEHIKL